MATFDPDLYAFVLAADEINFAIPATLPDGSATPDSADIRGNAHANILTGDDGYNYLYGGLGVDVLIGGDGGDRYYLDVDAGDQIVEKANGGYDTVLSNFTHTLMVNVETLELTGTANINGFGNADANEIYGNIGDNLLDGAAGDDILWADFGNDSILGGAGNDEIDGGDGDDTISGGAGNDTMYGGDGNDTLSFAAVTAGVTISLLKSMGGENIFDTYYGFENILGSNFSDSLTGNADNNLIQGGGGDDTLDGGANWDLLEGGAGNDTYVVDHYADAIMDTAGIDTVSTKMAAYTLAAGVENLIGSGTINFALTGGTTNNLITGNTGADSLYGMLGNDTLTGAAGQDHFFFNTAVNKKTNLDTISDFNVADDTIYLDRGTFSSLYKISKKGTVKASMFKIGTKAGDANDRIIYDKNKGALYYDADGTGKGAAVEFAKVAKKTALTHKDFFMV